MLMLKPTATRTGRAAAGAGGTPGAPAAGIAPGAATLGARALAAPPPIFPNSWICTWRWIPPNSPGNPTQSSIRVGTKATESLRMPDKDIAWLKPVCPAKGNTLCVHDHDCDLLIGQDLCAKTQEHDLEAMVASECRKQGKQLCQTIPPSTYQPKLTPSLKKH
jgi:hypothetical protein